MLSTFTAPKSPSPAFRPTLPRGRVKATIASTPDFKNAYQYDKLQRLTDIVQQGQSGGNAVTAKHITQSFNALSQRTQIARYQSTGTTNAVATTDFTFDTANRLSRKEVKCHPQMALSNRELARGVLERNSAECCGAELMDR